MDSDLLSLRLPLVSSACSNEEVTGPLCKRYRVTAARPRVLSPYKYLQVLTTARPWDSPWPLPLTDSTRFHVLFTPVGFCFTFPSRYSFPIGKRDGCWASRVVPRSSTKVAAFGVLLVRFSRCTGPEGFGFSPGRLRRQFGKQNVANRSAIWNIFPLRTEVRRSSSRFLTARSLPRRDWHPLWSPFVVAVGLSRSF